MSALIPIYIKLFISSFTSNNDYIEYKVIARSISCYQGTAKEGHSSHLNNLVS